MKAQRRHALQTNSLAHSMENLPEFFKLHGNKVLLGVIFIALVIVLIRYRASSAEQRTEAIATSLGNARNGISELRRSDPTNPPIQQSSQRKQVLSAARDSIQTVLDESNDPAIKAQALLARGDLFWTAANLPPIPGAATQPSLQLTQSKDELLKQSEESYQQVVKQYPSERPATAAQFGLAAIREDEKQFDPAEKIYNGIIANSTDPMFKDLATTRLALLEKAKTPVYIGSTEARTPTPFLTTRPSSAPRTTTTPAAHPATTTAPAKK
jgi:predicted negative regulator of RcsB-dependent stress response